MNLKNCLTLALICGLTGSASAGIITTSGTTTTIAAPSSVAKTTGIQSITETFAFNEQQDFTLNGNLNVDINTPGTYTDTAALAPGSIAAGTTVNSYFIHLQSVNSQMISLTGSVTFDSDVLGIITSNANLGSSDFLGNPGTVYPSGLTSRRVEFAPLDTVTLSADLRTVTFTLAASVIDQIRVITTAPVPTPGAAALLGLAGICGNPRRRRRA